MMRTRLSSHGHTTLNDQRPTTFTLAALAPSGPCTRGAFDLLSSTQYSTSSRRHSRYRFSVIARGRRSDATVVTVSPGKRLGVALVAFVENPLRSTAGFACVAPASEVERWEGLRALPRGLFPPPAAPAAPVDTDAPGV